MRRHSSYTECGSNVLSEDKLGALGFDEGKQAVAAFSHSSLSASLRPNMPRFSQPLGSPNLPLVQSKMMRDFVP